MSFTDPTQETLVVVGGEDLAQLDLVLDTVDSIRRETERVPSAVFLLTDDKFDVDLLKVNVSLRDVYSPALVRLQQKVHCLPDRDSHFLFQLREGSCPPEDIQSPRASCVQHDVSGDILQHSPQPHVPHKRFCSEQQTFQRVL